MNLNTPYIWKNGQFIANKQALDHNLSHALHYGGGVFEGIRFYNTPDWPKIFRLQEHIDRLFYSAGVFDLEIPFTKEELIQACLNGVQKNKLEAGYIRPIVYYGTGKMGLNPKGALEETVISFWEWGSYLGESAINVKIAKTRRIDPATTDMAAKVTGNYANSILVSLEIKKAGFDEGLLLDTSGYIAEGPGENIFFLNGDKVVTPELGTILPGITRRTVIQLFKDKFGIEVEERKVKPEELASFDQAFFVGTAAEVTPIASITNEAGDKFEYSSGEKDSLTMQMKALYTGLVTGKEKKYKEWLS